LVAHLKRQGKGKPYDCIMGLSGGVDSSYLAWLAVKKLDLRPLVVHVDAGWNSELAVNNIQSIVQRLGLDLHTLVVDWEEIRDLQRSYFRAGIANLDVPQDHAFFASLLKEARKYGIRDILNGGNMQTESILPDAWGYDASDPTSIQGIQDRFGSVRLKRYPMTSNLERLIINPYIRRMRSHRPLEYIDYNKDEAKELLKSELGWRDYGGKHYESVFTKFFQAHYLPTKFGYDKRLAHLSSLIVSGQMTKQQARAEMQQPLYDPIELEEDRIYWVKKLGLTMDEYTRVMAEKPSFYSDFPHSENGRLRSAMRMAAKVYRKVRR
jgi:N-acetyl sugar amidotransferase